MTLLSDTPPGAIAGAHKPATDVAAISFPYPTMDQRRQREAKPASKVELPEPNTGRLPHDVAYMNGAGGVVESTLSERGAALAAKQQQAVEAVARKEHDSAKAMGLDAGEAKAAAEIPPTNVAEQEAQAHTNNQQALAALQDQANKQARTQLDAMPVAGDPKPTKARRAPMPMVQRLQVMEAVRAAPADEPDAELATRLSLALNRAIDSGTIKSYRVQLGLKSVPMPTKAELRAKLLALQAELAAKEQPTLPGVPAKLEG